jgi:RsiW-degrading membrane proteinase PrsW (M82 family)
VSALGDLETFLALLLAALIPAIIYLTWIRSTNRYGREPWGPLLSAFFYGALFATIVAAVLEGILVAVGTAFSQAYPAPEFTFLNGNSTLGTFFLVLVIAPFIEEGLKGAGVVRMSDRIRLLPDGLVFGASVGLGFGFFETFLYGVGAYAVGGLEAGIVLIAVRSVSSVLLHASSTSMFGYGYAKHKLQGATGTGGAYYLLAVTMHASFNALASLGAIVAFLGASNTLSGYASDFGLLLAVVFAISAIEYTASVIHREDYPGAGSGTSRYRPPPPTVRIQRPGG